VSSSLEIRLSRWQDPDKGSLTFTRTSLSYLEQPLGLEGVRRRHLRHPGARLIIHGRSAEQAQVVIGELSEVNGRVEHRAYCGDLSELCEVERIGAAIASTEERMDILINNAGSIYPRRELNEAGIERTLAVNHISYFLLTFFLRTASAAAAPSRVVNTTSVAHRWYGLDLTDLQMESRYTAVKAYARSKLCNILFTRELAHRLLRQGTSANCVHPGFSATNLATRPAAYLAQQ
jgi:NAD(P)-dependent dehydrogenase (short-subunit alcohol dehydrogenase family)